MDDYGIFFPFQIIVANLAQKSLPVGTESRLFPPFLMLGEHIFAVASNGIVRKIWKINKLSMFQRNGEDCVQANEKGCFIIIIFYVSAW